MPWRNDDDYSSQNEQVSMKRRSVHHKQMLAQPRPKRERSQKYRRLLRRVRPSSLDTLLAAVRPAPGYKRLQSTCILCYSVLSLSFLFRLLRSRITAPVLFLFFLCTRIKPNVYARQHPWAHAGRCANEYLSASTKSFWKYSDGTLPTIADVLTSGNRLYVVLSLEVLENHRN